MALTDTYASVAVSGSVGTTNGSTPVTMISDPSTDPEYIVNENDLSVLNRDTASVTVTLTVAGTPSAVYEIVTLASGDKYTNPSRIVIGENQSLTVELSGAVSTTEPSWVVTYFRIVD